MSKAQVSFHTCKKTIFELTEKELRQIARDEFKHNRHHYRIGWSRESDAFTLPCRRCLISVRISSVTSLGNRFIKRCLKPERDAFMADPSVESKARQLATKALSLVKSEKKRSSPDRMIEVEKHIMWEEKAQELTKGLPIIAFLEKLREAKSTLDRNHPECPSCGLCYGGYHIAIPTLEVKELGKICQWCAIDYRKQGRAKFLKRLERPGGVVK